MRALFIGNSATYVHEVPETLSRLASEAGYAVEVGKITPGGCELASHADRSTEHGQRVASEIARGYDIVFFQDNGNCISSEEKREASLDACRRLCAVAHASGARAAFYVRPPYGYEKWGHSPFEQCRLFDELFCEAAEQGDALCVYANRAFAYAIKHHADIGLWGADNAHTSEAGAYLIVCTFFATLFGVSAHLLGDNGIGRERADALASIADKIALEGVIPWAEE